MEIISVKPSISKLVEDLYLDADTADVYFLFDSSKDEVRRIPAHKMFLRFRSEVFHVMFYSDLRELGDIVIVDATFDAFKEFLKFFYFDQPKIAQEHISEVLNLMRKYNTHSCMAACEKSLPRLITSENVCDIYSLSIEFGLAETEVKCEQYLALNAFEVFPTDNFRECSYETVLRIVSMERMVCDEIYVFRACLAWARSQCLEKGLDADDVDNLRIQLRDIIYAIRFRSMKADEIADIMGRYRKLLSHDDLADLGILSLIRDELDTKLCFRRRVQAWSFNPLLIFGLISRTATLSSDMNRIETISFCVDKPVILREIRLRSLYVHKAWNDFTRIKVENYDKSKLKLHILEKSPLHSPEMYDLNIHTTEPNKVKFGDWNVLHRMIHIKPHVTYDIQLEYWDKTGKVYHSFNRDCNKVLFNRRVSVVFSGRGTGIAALRFCKNY